MKELVVLKNSQAVTTSTIVAESFEKRHDNVLRDIQDLKKDVLNFEEIFREGVEPDSYGRSRKVFYMNRDGFTLLAMGFTGRKAIQFKLKYISAFNEMEAKIAELNQPSYMIDNPITRAEKWITERKQYEALETQVKQNEPFTKFGKQVSNSNGAINIGEFCKIIYQKHGISMGRNKMFAWLRDKGYLIKFGREKNTPKQTYVEQELFISVPTIVARSEGDVQRSTTMITGKGQVKITHQLLLENSQIEGVSNA
ncbi:phage regulatory protein/antirepressor Ant [Sporolactobacillus laevolacticus]|uniref:Antirepressor n=1 Tax=Sporolactobacillus laevolacticus DSM 442 TaxID=1395513 RepID=V6IV91_9BACL|nr:phage regulatory protein/antirepressor Ant [Sporolactobacillus laevolacticus]EST11118.1 antirepressor [Sporolactobacillus laevolacticus DSM 442]